MQLLFPLKIHNKAQLGNIIFVNIFNGLVCHFCLVVNMCRYKNPISLTEKFQFDFQGYLRELDIQVPLTSNRNLVLNLLKTAVLNFFVPWARWSLSGSSPSQIWLMGQIWHVGSDLATQRREEDVVQPQFSCTGERGCVPTPIWLFGAWEFGSRVEMAVLNATAPLPPNFLTHGKPCRPDAMAPWTRFSLQAGC